MKTVLFFTSQTIL